MLGTKIQNIKFKLGHWWSYCRTQQALQPMKRNHFNQVLTHALLSSKSPAITTVYNLSWVEFTTTNTQIVLTTESCKPEGQYSTCAKHRSLTLFTQVLRASLYHIKSAMSSKFNLPKIICTCKLWIKFAWPNLQWVSSSRDQGCSARKSIARQSQYFSSFSIIEAGYSLLIPHKVKSSLCMHV